MEMERNQDPLAAHLERGVRGEALAFAYLKERGWEEVTRNFTTERGEIDIIVSRPMEGGEGTMVAFIEVKSRSSTSQTEPELSVTAKKRRRIVSVAKEFVDRFGRANTSYRFDVIAVDLGEEPPKIRHFEGAFDVKGNPY